MTDNVNDSKSTVPAGIKPGTKAPVVPPAKAPVVPPAKAPAIPPVAKANTTPPAPVPAVAKPAVVKPAVAKATTAPIKKEEVKENNIVASHDAQAPAKSNDSGALVEAQLEGKAKAAEELAKAQDSIIDAEDKSAVEETIFVPEDLKEVEKAFNGDTTKIAMAKAIVVGMTGPFFTDYYFKMKGRFGDKNIREASGEMIKYAKILVETMDQEGLI